MLNSITWTQYLSGLIILTLIYYTWIAIRFYPQALRTLLSGKKNIPFQSAEPAPAEQQLPASQILPDQPITPIQNGEETFDRIESLITGLKSQIHRKGAGAMETSILEKLRTVIHAYPDLKGSPFCPSINEMIISECQLAKIPPPDETELQQLW